jgi:uncharacterized membrane protein
VTGDADQAPSVDLERSIARLLTIGTYGSVALLAIGVVVMLARGIAPLAGGPRFTPGLVVDDVAHLRPTGFIWLGLLAVIATPSARVVASLVGYVRRRERGMVAVAVAILVVIALSVVLARGLEA